MNKFMELALKEAEKGVKKNKGGPFGAVIVKDNKIIAKAYNSVPSSKDATCHAEINAIRKASKKLKRFDLSDCELYITCEPCPMCFAAICWAKIKKIYWSASRKDAADIGFDDKFIYDIFSGKEKSKVKSLQIDKDSCEDIMKKWNSKKDKISY